MVAGDPGAGTVIIAKMMAWYSDIAVLALV